MHYVVLIHATLVGKIIPAQQLKSTPVTLMYRCIAQIKNPVLRQGFLLNALSLKRQMDDVKQSFLHGLDL